MSKNTVFEGETVALAIQKACEANQVREEELKFEIVKEEKKNLFGKIKEPAQIKVLITGEEKGQDGKEKKVQIAKAYLETLLIGLGVENISIEDKETPRNIVLSVSGDKTSIAIGRRGETIDALQYLVCLTANHGGGEYIRFVIDCGEFREKREQTLQKLAINLSSKVLRTGRSVTLEPMNPYERRIIHFAVSEIEGVGSKSKGDEPRRRIIIFKERNEAGAERKPRSAGKEETKKVSNQPSTYDFEKEFLKSERTESKLYSKIEVEKD